MKTVRNHRNWSPMYRSPVLDTGIVLTGLKCVHNICLQLFFVSVFSFVGPLVSLEVPSQFHYKILFQRIKKGEWIFQTKLSLLTDQIENYFPSTGGNPYRNFSFKLKSLVSVKFLCDFLLQTQIRLKVIPIGIFLSKSKLTGWNRLNFRDNRKSTESNSNSSDDPEGNPLNMKSSRKHLNTTAGKRRKLWERRREETFRAFNSGK